MIAFGVCDLFKNLIQHTNWIQSLVDSKKIKNCFQENRRSSLTEMNIDALLPRVLEKLQTEGFELRSQDSDKTWLKDVIAARLATSDVLENILRDALRQPDKS